MNSYCNLKLQRAQNNSKRANLVVVSQIIEQQRRHEGV